MWTCVSVLSLEDESELRFRIMSPVGDVEDRPFPVQRTSDSLEMKWMRSSSQSSRKKASLPTGGIGAHSMAVPNDWDTREFAKGLFYPEFT